MPGSGGSSCAKPPDPLQQAVLQFRAGIVNARETAKKIAASPIVEQEGELCFSLYNAAGDCVLTSTGIIIHVGTMGAAIKYMIENGWEENPGIAPGDMFCNNDCLIGNVHPCDVHDRPDLLGRQPDRLGRRRDACDRYGRGGTGFDDHRPGAALR